MAESATERLESWWAKHKRRSVYIDIDDGYGSTAWVVELRDGNQGQIHMVGCRLDEEESVPANNTYSYVPGHGDDIPTLAETIHAAIDAAERQGKEKDDG